MEPLEDSAQITAVNNQKCRGKTDQKHPSIHPSSAAYQGHRGTSISSNLWVKGWVHQSITYNYAPTKKEANLSNSGRKWQEAKLLRENQKCMGRICKLLASLLQGKRATNCTTLQPLKSILKYFPVKSLAWGSY